MSEGNKEKFEGLKQVYSIEGPDQAHAFYNQWSESYDNEVSENGYITPKRCADALARFAADPKQPIMDLACGTGLSGVALHAAGFEIIDGFDLSEGMLEKARQRGIYRNLALADLSKPLEMTPGTYHNAAAIGCVSPEYMPPTVLDEILSKLPSGGCLTFSINDHAAKDGSISGRIMELVDCGMAELMFSEYGDHLPEISLNATVYVLRKR